MQTYSDALSKVFKDWKSAIVVGVFTIARVIYGWAWFEAGWEKLAWLSDGKLNAQGKIQGLVAAIGPNAQRFDPLGINKTFAWIADNIFLNMPAFTDFLVVAFELLIGLVIIFGFKVFWGALVAMFLNLQFIAAGSFNNFGYIWTNLALMKWAKYFEAVGIDGYLRVKKGKNLLK
ncbi:DoxX family membrane protein [Neobacillus sp. SM06]|uniref:DoxX family membrane protein n=1 Tax=Neobacillus sp. SM06 TaxID=3422492 RepID=UPI003D27EF13